jgi:hypothetical protein
MNIEEIRDFVLSEMEKKIKSVLDGEKTEVTLYYVRPNDVIRCVEKLGGKDEEEFDSNGWQWDYWLYFTYKDNRYSLGGDGYYSNHCTFSLDNED